MGHPRSQVVTDMWSRLAMPAQGCCPPCCVLPNRQGAFLQSGRKAQAQTAGCGMALAIRGRVEADEARRGPVKRAFLSGQESASCACLGFSTRWSHVLELARATHSHHPTEVRQLLLEGSSWTILSWAGRLGGSPLSCERRTSKPRDGPCKGSSVSRQVETRTAPCVDRHACGHVCAGLLCTTARGTLSPHSSRGRCSYQAGRSYCFWRGLIRPV